MLMCLHLPKMIVVGTPHFLHHQMVLDALEAGKDVICEKPLAMNEEQAREMIDKAKAMNKRLFVGLNMRTNAGFRTVEKALNEGTIGKVFLARISYLGHEIERLQDPNHWKGTLDKAGGGILLDGGYHVIDIMNMLFGEPKEVKAMCSKGVVQAENKGEDNAILLLEYPENILGEVTASFTVKGEKSKQEPTLGLRLDVFGTAGSISTQYYSHDGLGWRTTLVSDDEATELPLEPFSPDNLPTHFIDCLVGGQPPIVTAEDALNVQKIVDKAYAQTQTSVCCTQER